ncbi:hypothetical protein ACEYYB_00985 [Paracoccus sp. p4-l81]|uniref:hypothetical protein n=1 Tax=Paracoccus sp. p4-l81 TaxID=3342806 RepID=UPI0035B6F34B
MTAQVAARTYTVAIRTNRWDANCTRLFNELRAEGIDPWVVFHGDASAAGLPTPNVVPIDDGWIARRGLRHLHDWGWRCGDYFYYALRLEGPKTDDYWLVEPDLYNTRGWADFFNLFTHRADDALGYKPGPVTRPSPFVGGARGRVAIGTIFCLTRMSGSALDYLYSVRRRYGMIHKNEQNFANDEIFCFSWLVSRGFKVGDLAELGADYFAGTHFTYGPDILEDALHGGPHGIYHPVRTRADYCREIGTRYAKMRRLTDILAPSIALLGPGDADQIGAAFTAALRDILTPPAGDTP